MKLWPLLFLLISFSCSNQNESKVQNRKITQVDSANAAVQPLETTEYKGAWFEITYPANFIAQPSMRSSTSQDGFESAFFHAPDSTVVFYIFSPQWNGKPLDIEQKANEKAGDFTSETNEKITINRWSIVDKHKKYTWAFEETVDHASNTNKVFGIRYKSQKDLKKYRDAYLNFKSSLKQFAD